MPQRNCSGKGEMVDLHFGYSSKRVQNGQDHGRSEGGQLKKTERYRRKKNKKIYEIIMKLGGCTQSCLHLTCKDLIPILICML